MSKNIIKKLRKFLKTETPSGFADGLIFGKYQDLLGSLEKGELGDPAVLAHFLKRPDVK